MVRGLATNVRGNVLYPNQKSHPAYRAYTPDTSGCEESQLSTFNSNTHSTGKESGKKKRCDQLKGVDTETVVPLAAIIMMMMVTTMITMMTMTVAMTNLFTMKTMVVVVVVVVMMTMVWLTLLKKSLT